MRKYLSKTILSKPSLQWSTFNLRASNDIIPSLKNTRFFSSGSVALVAALKRLGLARGSLVAIPAYICKGVILALESSGFRIEFFDIQQDLSISESTIRELNKNEKVAAILLVDYFGLTSRSIDNCMNQINDAEHLIIVDCCHSGLKTGNVFVADGRVDALIYSWRKTLIARNGGAVLYNKLEDLDLPEEGAQSGVKDLGFLILRTLESLIGFLGWPNLYDHWLERVRRAFKDLLPARKIQTPLLDPQQPTWFLHKQLSNQRLLRSISQKRRRNYIFLATKLVNLPGEFLFPELKEEDVPQVFPMLCSYDGLLEFLRKNKVGAYRWPGEELPDSVRMNRKDFPVANSLNDRCICLPIHQTLDQKELAFISCLVESWLKNHKDNR